MELKNLERAANLYESIKLINKEIQELSEAAKLMMNNDTKYEAILTIKESKGESSHENELKINNPFFMAFIGVGKDTQENLFEIKLSESVLMNLFAILLKEKRQMKESSIESASSLNVV